MNAVLPRSFWNFFLHTICQQLSSLSEKMLIVILWGHSKTDSFKSFIGIKSLDPASIRFVWFSLVLILLNGSGNHLEYCYFVYVLVKFSSFLLVAVIIVNKKCLTYELEAMISRSHLRAYLKQRAVIYSIEPTKNL